MPKNFKYLPEGQRIYAAYLETAAVLVDIAVGIDRVAVAVAAADVANVISLVVVIMLPEMLYDPIVLCYERAADAFVPVGKWFRVNKRKINRNRILRG